jgi:protein involved in ribonucleotide reduction
MTQINKKINIINYNNKSDILSSENVQYISISTSNYSSVYVVANKIMNTIFVCFRGTYSVKSGLSYLKLSSITPKNICHGSNDGYLLGVFKIISEIFYTIEESINYLSTHFLKTSKIKIVTTGHSLGGGAASIFSYLWIKHKPELKIVCVTFGSPRVMNSALIEKFNELIISKTILFKRYITNGDPFAKLPITSKKFENSYYFPDDYDESLSFVAITCNHIKKTRKVLCNLKNKTKKRKIDIKSHGIYLGVSYKGAANNVTDLNKEIIRDTNNDTICRIIIGGNNDNFRAVFFNLTEAKMKKQDFISSKLAKIKKTFFQVDYKHQDIYINKKMFEKLIKASAELDNENLNPLISDKIVEIEHKNPKQELNCI